MSSADPRVQQARERAKAALAQAAVMRRDDCEEPLWEMLRVGGSVKYAEDVLYLADRVAALETALRDVNEAAFRVTAAAVAVSHLLEEPYPDAPEWTPWSRFVQPRLSVLEQARKQARAALAGSGTEPAQEQPTAPCYVCGHPVAEGEGWRRDSKTWCPDHRPVWSHD